MNKFFILYSNCLFVKGDQRSIICDLQNGEFEFVPNDLYNLFDENRIDVFLKRELLSESDKIIFDEYLDFLNSKRLGFYSNGYFEQLVSMNLEWRSFSKVTNCILEVGSWCNKEIIEKISHELDELNCVALEIKFYDTVDINSIIKVLDVFNNSILRSIVILIQYNSQVKVEVLEEIAKKNVRLCNIFIANSPYEKIELVFSKSVRIIFSKNKIIDSKCCGLIGPQSFSVNINHFSESNSYNSCLNRKIAIDKDGNIRNCPSMPDNFGNIKDTTLEEALNKPGFKKYWNITKDQIEVCKDCEFRYICTDCRAYTERTHTNKEGLDISKPLKCGYNPYTAEWAEWSTNPLKQKAIDFYGMREIL